MKKIIIILITIIATLFIQISYAAEHGVKKIPGLVDLRDQASLQRGAQIFVSYCLSCHSASLMRYNRLTDLGLTEKQIEDNFIFNGGKVGETMRIALDRDDAKNWFGVVPPDLSLIARYRGADWLYEYLEGFYQDPSKRTGWNNLIFDGVSMPHVLWEQQGIRKVELDKNGKPIMVKNHDGSLTPKLKWVSYGTLTYLKSNGKVSTADYDKYVKDLVNYLVYMGEPIQRTRKQIGYLVIAFLLTFLLPLTYFLNKEYWKDIGEH